MPAGPSSTASRPSLCTATITGSAFLFVVMEFLAAGIDVNDRAFEALKRSASPYVRHRIGSIQGFMARGAGLGRSMVLAGQGFPDPSLVPVVAALDGAPGWERKLARFVERWVGRSEELLRARAAALNGALLTGGGRGHGIGHRRDVLDPRSWPPGGNGRRDHGSQSCAMTVGARRAALRKAREHPGKGKTIHRCSQVGRAAGGGSCGNGATGVGFSLFGVLLGLTLAAVAIVGAVSLYNAARESANRSQALTLLNQLRANVESVFAGAPSYGNSTNLIATVDRRGSIPDSARVVSGNTVQIRHPFGGLVTIVGGPGGETNQFRIVFRDVDDEVCAALGDAYAGRSRARAGIVSLTINGTALTSPVTVASR